MPQRENAFVEIVTTALGYFAVMFLLQLTAVLETTDELNGITFTDTLSETIGDFQNAGLLLGALVWGWLAGLKGWGRVRVLFFAVMIYSLGAFLNGYAWSEGAFIVARFITAVGMAGELGTGLALVYETLNRKKWGFSAGIICALAFLSPYLAYHFHSSLPLNQCFFIGGTLGLLVLLLRVSVEESPQFQRFIFRGENTRTENWGSLGLKFLFLFLFGLQTHLIVSVLGPNLPDILPGLCAPRNPAQLMSWYFPGHIASSLICGWLLNRFEDRKTVFKIFGATVILAFLAYFCLPQNGLFSSWQLRLVLLGLANGVWLAYIAMGVESFPISVRVLGVALLLNGSRALAPIFDALIMKGDVANFQIAVLSCVVVAALYWVGLFCFFRNNNLTEAP